MSIFATPRNSEADALDCSCLATYTSAINLTELLNQSSEGAFHAAESCQKLMREGKLALGKYVSLADPQVVEIIGIAGFDAAFIDMEHTGFDLRTIEEMIRASDLAGVTTMVRVLTTTQS